MSAPAVPTGGARRGVSHGYLQGLGRAARWAWQRPWLALPLLAIPALFPLLVNGLPVSHDGPLHLLRLVLLDRHIHQGTLFQRWMPE